MEGPSAPASGFRDLPGLRLHHLEAGAGEPAVVLLHGIPTHAHLWRNVLPHLSPLARTLALDLPGSGASDKPLGITYDLPFYGRCLAEWVAALDLRSIVLVGLDLGLLAMLQFAARHEARVRGLVLMEGFFLPMPAVYGRLPVSVRLPLRLLRWRWLAERVLVAGTRGIDRMLAASTVRPLEEAELEVYRAPWRDPAVRRRVWLEGVGPRGLRPSSRAPGDLVDLIGQNAAWLQGSSLPKLLLTARPGRTVTPRVTDLARASLSNLEVVELGAGRHLLPEDQPERLGQAIAAFVRRLQGSSGAHG